MTFAALGGLVTVLWPLVPALQPLLPAGLVFAVGAWFLIVTRLQNRGVEEFLELVEVMAAGAGES